MQRYFEAEHSATAIIHPRTELANITPDGRDKRATPQSTSKSSKRGLRRFPPRSTAPVQSLRPAHGSMFGQAIPAYPSYTGYAPLNNRAPPAPLYNGTVMYAKGNSSTCPIYKHGSFPFRY